MDNLTQKYLLYKQFVAWAYNGCSTARLTDYIKEAIDKDECSSVKSNE